ncbi:MAG: dephospho-CoA kinase [Gammaproteobacteria bacterium]
MLKIGLIGGVAAGKSSVAKHFAKHGIPVLDADVFAKEVTAVGTVPYQKIIRHFGPSILLPNKELNRKLLRNIIFCDPEDKKWLEKLLHPRIYTAMRLALQKIKAPCVVLVLSALLESPDLRFQKLLDFVITVESTKKLQIQRLCERDKISAKLAKAMINGQVGSKERIAYADCVIKNNGTLAGLQKQLGTE